MNAETNENKVEPFTPNLVTLRTVGFLVPGKPAKKYCALIINAVIYPLAILLIVLEIISTKFTLRTSVEFLFVTVSTFISFSRRIFFWRNGKQLKKLLECFKDEPQFSRPEFEQLRQQISPKSSSKTAAFNWTFCSLRSVLLAMSIAAALCNIFYIESKPMTQPLIAGRKVFFKMWFFKATHICDWQYFAILAFQVLIMTLNLLSMASVDAFNNAVMLSQAERAKMLNTIAAKALAPCRRSENRISQDFKQLINYYDHLENTLAAADHFSGQLMVAPSLSGIAILMIYGIELIKTYNIQPFYIVCSTMVQLYSCHKAGQVFTDNCIKLNQTVTNLPLTTDEGMLPGDFRANLMTLATLMRTSRRLRGFSGNGLFKISLDFFAMIVLGTTGYVFFVSLIIK